MTKPQQFTLGLLVGFSLALGLGFRMSRPPVFIAWSPADFVRLNDTLLQLWNITNGRYTLDTLTSDPNGSRQGSRGDLIYATYGGNDYLCVNTSTVTPWTTWACK